MAARARTRPATSVSMCPASASRARLPVRKPAATSTPRKAQVIPRTRASRRRLPWGWWWACPWDIRPEDSRAGPASGPPDGSNGRGAPSGRGAILARFARSLISRCAREPSEETGDSRGGRPRPRHQQRHRRRHDPRRPRGGRGPGDPRRLRVDHAGQRRPRAPADHRRGEPHPLPRRLAHRDLARQPHEEPGAPREHGHLAAAPQRLAAHHDRRRRHRLLGDEARGEGRRAASRSSTSRRRSTTTSTCPPTSTPSASRPRATSASTSSRT